VSSQLASPTLERRPSIWKARCRNECSVGDIYWMRDFEWGKDQSSDRGNNARVVVNGQEVWVSKKAHPHIILRLDAVSMVTVKINSYNGEGLNFKGKPQYSEHVPVHDIDRPQSDYETVRNPTPHEPLMAKVDDTEEPLHKQSFVRLCYLTSAEYLFPTRKYGRLTSSCVEDILSLAKIGDANAHAQITRLQPEGLSSSLHNPEDLKQLFEVNETSDPNIWKFVTACMESALKVFKSRLEDQEHTISAAPSHGPSDSTDLASIDLNRKRGLVEERSEATVEKLQLAQSSDVSQEHLNYSSGHTHMASTSDRVPKSQQNSDAQAQGYQDLQLMLANLTLAFDITTNPLPLAKVARVTEIIRNMREEAAEDVSLSLKTHWKQLTSTQQKPK
jgi:hypothetical protein